VRACWVTNDAFAHALGAKRLHHARHPERLLRPLLGDGAACIAASVLLCLTSLPLMVLRATRLWMVDFMLAPTDSDWSHPRRRWSPSSTICRGTMLARMCGHADRSLGRSTLINVSPHLRGGVERLDGALLAVAVGVRLEAAERSRERVEVVPKAGIALRVHNSALGNATRGKKRWK